MFYSWSLSNFHVVSWVRKSTVYKKVKQIVDYIVYIQLTHKDERIALCIKNNSLKTRNVLLVYLSTRIFSDNPVY